MVERERCEVTQCHKKKVLIVAMSMHIGGAERSLINLLSLMDYNKFRIDLLLFKQQGAFLSEIPSEVKVISAPELETLYGAHHHRKISAAKKLSISLRRYLGTCFSWLKEKQFDRRRIERWEKWYAEAVPPLDGLYDVAVAYSAGEVMYYCIDKVRARRQVVVFHSDYSCIDIDLERELCYLERENSILSVSEQCVDSLKTLFPCIAEKVHLFKNPSSVAQIKKRANEMLADCWSSTDALHIVAIGRLHKIKNHALAIRAVDIVAQKRPGRIELVIVGDGPEYYRLKQLIGELELQEVVTLLGSRDNPYPYLACSDLLLHTSYFEGSPMVLDEAALLSKPVVSVRYPSVEDKISHGVNGLISESNATELAECLLEIVDNREILTHLTSNINRMDFSAFEDISDFLDALDPETKHNAA
ncbi:glycosyltransferase [Adlercreutzia equolifaciens]|nr:glycosyltransferase [Adlercreutzia equolifaciens]